MEAYAVGVGTCVLLHGHYIDDTNTHSAILGIVIHPGPWIQPDTLALQLLEGGQIRMYAQRSHALISHHLVNLGEGKCLQL